MDNAVRQRIISVLSENCISINSLSGGDKALQRKMNRQINEGAAITSETISSILDAIPNLAAEWLMTGRGAMFKDEQLPTTKERLLHFLESENISEDDFRESVGMSYAFFHEMKSNIPDKYLKKIIEKYPQLSIEWLLAGEWKMLKTSNDQLEVITDYSDEGPPNEIDNLKREIEELKAEINMLKGENRILREQVGLGERK